MPGEEEAGSTGHRAPTSPKGRAASRSLGDAGEGREECEVAELGDGSNRRRNRRLAVPQQLHQGAVGQSRAGGSVPRLRPRVVVLGSGWGANAVLSQLKNADVDLTVISPRNFFLFTPMLAGAALGTLEPRSIIQPIREANPYATYYEAEAEVINLAAKTVTCESVECNGLPRAATSRSSTFRTISSSSLWEPRPIRSG